MSRLSLAAIISALAVLSATAMVISSKPGSAPKAISRRTFGATIAASSTAFLLHSTPAKADITNKLASSAALRTVKSAQKKLSSMELYISQNDYTSLKEALRVAPFADIRKACFTLVRGGEDGPDAEELNVRYKKFMTSLEKMDSLASLGMRGRDVKNEEFYSSFTATVDALSSFVELAKEASEIPVQYTENAMNE